MGFRGIHGNRKCNICGRACTFLNGAGLKTFFRISSVLVVLKMAKTPFVVWNFVSHIDVSTHVTLEI